MNQSNLITEAEYADIILTLINKPYCITSITKLIFIAFCIEHVQINSILTYRNRTKDFIDVFFNNISVQLLTYHDDIKIILHFINILHNTNKIGINCDEIIPTNIVQHNTENTFLNFCNNQKINPIIEISKLDAKGLIEEVIRYV